MPFKIPTQTPAGAYLLRVDMVFNYWNSPAQLYPACAQVLVEGNATGALPKGVKFPEVYDPSMPGKFPLADICPIVLVCEMLM
jgi:hypothetical protein